MENNNDLVVDNKPKSAVEQLIRSEVSKTNNVDDAVELLVTHESLTNAGTLNKLVEEKGKEQEHKYEAKRLEAEALKYEKEAEKVRQEKEKELAELDKEISAKQKEVEKLKAESDKADTFYKSNEEILSCIGIKSAKSLKVMYSIMPIAIFVFMLIRFIALPLTIGGKLVEIVIDIVGGICKKISNNALKITISIFVVALLIGGVFCAYYFGGKLIS